MQEAAFKFQDWREQNLITRWSNYINEGRREKKKSNFSIPSLLYPFTQKLLFYKLL